MAFDYVESQELSCRKHGAAGRQLPKYIDAVEAACDAAKLTPVAITSTARWCLRGNLGQIFQAGGIGAHGRGGRS